MTNLTLHVSKCFENRNHTCLKTHSTVIQILITANAIKIFKNSSRCGKYVKSFFNHLT